jgi:hypothetical protein
MLTIRVKSLPLVTALTSLCLAPTVADAAWPSDPTINVPLCTAASSQDQPVIVSDGAGGAIAAWKDYRSGSSYDIYAQRVNGAGVPLWTADGVALCTAAGDQDFPTIVSDGAGGAIVTWEDDRGGDSNWDIYAQRVNAAGVPQWTANGVALCTAAGPQLNPTIASDGAAGAIVTWRDGRTGYVHIYAQRVNAAGVPQWTADGVALCTAAVGQDLPTIVSDGAGGAIVTWFDGRHGSGTADIYAQQVNAAGVPQWTADGVALCTAAGNQILPTIVSDGAGGAIVTWQDARSGTNNDIYAQRVAFGVPQWTADGVALCTAANDQLNPTIVSDGAGGAIVTWQDYRSGTNYDIYAQRVNKAGVVQWPADGVALCAAANTQDLPAIVSDGAGGAIVTWEDYRNGTNWDIYAQRVNAAGVPQCGADGVKVSTAAGNQDAPTIAAEGAGGAIVTWQDARSGTYDDIYAQNFNGDCTLGGTTVSVPAVPIAAGFALSRVEPNPSAGELRVSFSLLDDTPASLEVYDLTGRRLESQELGRLGAGAHIVSLGRGFRWPPGIYEVRLQQGGRSGLRKVAIVR